MPPPVFFFLPTLFFKKNSHKLVDPVHHAVEDVARVLYVSGHGKGGKKTVRSWTHSTQLNKIKINNDKTPTASPHTTPTWSVSSRFSTADLLVRLAAAPPVVGGRTGPMGCWMGAGKGPFAPGVATGGNAADPPVIGATIPSLRSTSAKPAVQSRPAARIKSTKTFLRARAWGGGWGEGAVR